MFVVSHVSLLHIHFSISPKNDYWCGLLLLERTVKFLTRVHVVLGKQNNCLPTAKQQMIEWLRVKHVSIVSGKTYVKGALLIISSTSNNTVCNSSKWLQRSKWLQKIRKGAPHPLPPKFVSGVLPWKWLYILWQIILFNIVLLRRFWAQMSKLPIKGI